MANKTRAAEKRFTLREIADQVQDAQDSQSDLFMTQLQWLQWSFECDPIFELDVDLEDSWSDEKFRAEEFKDLMEDHLAESGSAPLFYGAQVPIHQADRIRRDILLDDAYFHGDDELIPSFYYS